MEFLKRLSVEKFTKIQIVYFILLFFYFSFIVTSYFVIGLPNNDSGIVYGFSSGLFHGITLYVSLLFSIFGDTYSVYGNNNSGTWYDSGFAIGVFVLFWLMNLNKRNR